MKCLIHLFYPFFFVWEFLGNFLIDFWAHFLYSLYQSYVLQIMSPSLGLVFSPSLWYLDGQKFFILMKFINIFLFVSSSGIVP